MYAYSMSQNCALLIWFPQYWHKELSRVAPMPVWNGKMAGYQVASRQVSVNSYIFLEFTALQRIPVLLFKC